MMFRTLLVAAISVSLPTILSAQSLVERSEQAKATHAAQQAADTKAGRTPAVYANPDLPASTMPPPPAVTGVTVPAPATVPAPSAVTLRDAELARDHERLTRRELLVKAQTALRAAEQSQRDLQHTYENTCGLGRPPRTMITACSNMRYTLRVDVPAALEEIRASIRTFAGQLGQ